MNRIHNFKFSIVGIIIVFLAACSNDTSNGSIDIDRVPISFPVNFALYTTNTHQFVAYYDSTHQLMLASRKINKNKWDYATLDSKVAWDSHNYLSIAIDKSQNIHLIGNMHSSPLIYFRSTKPLDIHSMVAINEMTGNEEDLTTYPEFIENGNGELIFHYRFGRSGNGYEVYNIWDDENQHWSRLLDKPLIDGEGEMNAYMQGPVAGPDGLFHLLWVWRDSPDCASNHTLSYARSKDLLNWESVRGEQVELPITIRDTVLVVDPTPAYGGLLNIGVELGFDCDNNVLAAYHKYDNEGNTQLFLGRFQNDEWYLRQLTSWPYRWDFKGWGSIKRELMLESPACIGPGTIGYSFHHINYGDKTFWMSNLTFEVVEIKPYVPEYPVFVDSLIGNQDGLMVNKVMDAGKSMTDKKYMLRWETFDANRDQQPSEIKGSTVLQLIEY